jgi:hypothetical protein
LIRNEQAADSMMPHHQLVETINTNQEDDRIFKERISPGINNTAGEVEENDPIILRLEIGKLF